MFPDIARPVERSRLTEKARSAPIATQAEEGAPRGIVLLVLVAAKDGAGDGTGGLAATAGAGARGRSRV